VEICCCFYNCSSEVLFAPDNNKLYNLSDAKEARYRKFLGALQKACKKTTPSRNSGSWEPAMELDAKFEQYLHSIQRNMAELGMADITKLQPFFSLDDDLIRLRSWQVSSYGLTHTNNPVKGYVDCWLSFALCVLMKSFFIARFGVVNTMCVDLITGVIVSFHIQTQFDKSVGNAIRKIIQVLQRGTERPLRAIWAIDRGYLTDEVARLIASAGGEFIGTFKSLPTSAFISKEKAESRTRASKDPPKEIPTKGANAAYFAVCSDSAIRNGKPDMYYLGYRNGVGNLVHLVGNLKDCGPGNFSYVTKPKLLDGAEVEERQIDCFLEYEKEYVAVILDSQRNAAWFLMRKHMFTGTATKKYIKFISRLTPSPSDNEKSQLEQRAIFLSSIVFELVTGRKAGVLKINKDIDVLGLAELRKLCIEEELLDQGNKKTLGDRLHNHYNAMADNERLVYSLFISASYLPPLSSPEMKLGSANEKNVLAGIKSFLDCLPTCDFTILELKEYGLLSHRELQGACFSPDAIAMVSWKNGTEGDTIDLTDSWIQPHLSDARFYRSTENYMAIEIKTRTTENTLQKEQQLAEEGKYTAIFLSASQNTVQDQNWKLFRDAVPEEDHRFQLLHQTCCGYVSSSIIVYASRKEIIRVIRISVTADLRRLYLDTILRIREAFLPWVMGDVNIPLKFQTLAPKEFGHAVDFHTVMESLALGRKLWDQKMNGLPSSATVVPHPAAVRITPAIVDLYNRGKGGVDISSRYLKQAAPNHKKVLPPVAIIIRTIRMNLLCAFQTYRNLKNDSKIPELQYVKESFISF
jgi:hypothetical protein